MLLAHCVHLAVDVAKGSAQVRWEQFVADRQVRVIGRHVPVPYLILVVLVDRLAGHRAVDTAGAEVIGEPVDGR